MTLLSSKPDTFNKHLDRMYSNITNTALQELVVAYAMTGDDPKGQLFPLTFEALKGEMQGLQCQRQHLEAWQFFCKSWITKLCDTMSALVYNNVHIYHLLMLNFAKERLHLMIEYEIRFFVENLRAWAYVGSDLRGAYNSEMFVQKSMMHHLHDIQDPEFTTTGAFYEKFEIMATWFADTFTRPAWTLHIHSCFEDVWQQFESGIEKASLKLIELAGDINRSWCMDQMVRLQIELVATTSTFIYFGRNVHDMDWTSASHVLKLENKLTNIVFEFLGSPWHGTGICRDMMKHGLACLSYPMKTLQNAVCIGDATAFASCYMTNTQKIAMQVAVLSALHPRLGRQSLLQMLDDDIIGYIMQELVFRTDVHFLPFPLTIGPFDHICC